ncbi:MAG: hypothetical protein AAF703_22165 [Cyanobacteria bacterium P01_D01_bin.105]
MSQSNTALPKKQRAKGQIRELMAEIEQLRAKEYALTAIYAHLKEQNRVSCKWSNFRTYYYKFRKEALPQAPAPAVAANATVPHESHTHEPPVIPDALTALPKPESVSSASKSSASESLEKSTQSSIIGGFDYEANQAIAQNIFKRNRKQQ